MKEREKIYVLVGLLFWGVMIVLTIRIWYQRENNTPVVSFVYPHKDYITHEIAGTGQISFEETTQIGYIKGLSIDSYLVEDGDRAKSGDALYQYNVASLEEELTEKELKLLEYHFLLSQVANEKYGEVLHSRISIMQKDVDLLKRLYEQEGSVFAEEDGWVVRVGEEAVTIGMGDVSVIGEFSGYYDNADKLLGTDVNVAVGSMVLQGKLTECTQRDSKCRCIVEIEAIEQYMPEVTFSLEWGGKSYQACLPADALHTENGECFVYVLEEQQGILGNTYAAAKRDVTLLDINDSLAAVEGNLPATERVIAYSDHELYDGCPVVLEE